MNAFRRVRAVVPTSFYYALFTFLLLIVVAPLIGRGINSYTFQSVAQTTANTLPLALAVGLTMMIGEFDTSVVATYSLGAMITVQLGSGGNIFFGLVVALVASIAIGLIQGYIITKFDISSVPVTLGGFIVIWGITNLIGGGKQVVLTDAGSRAFFTDPVFGPFTGGSLIMLGAAVVIALLMRFTIVGTTIHAVGSDRRASRISGVRVTPTLIIVFVVAAVVAGLGGAIFGVSFGNASPDVGFAPLVTAVIAAVLGGAGVAGQRGTALGIVFGVLTMAFLRQALLASGLDPNYLNVITGLFLIIIATFGSGELSKRVRSFRTLRLRTERLGREESAGNV